MTPATEVSMIIPRAWQETKRRSRVRAARETSLWTTPEEIGVYGIAAEIVERRYRGLDEEPAYRLSDKGLTCEPDILEAPSVEIKTTLWVLASAQRAATNGHVWVDSGAQADWLVLYGSQRCASWPRKRCTEFRLGEAAVFMDRCANGTCAQEHYVRLLGGLPMAKVRTYPLVAGKGLRGTSHMVPVSDLMAPSRREPAF